MFSILFCFHFSFLQFFSSQLFTIHNSIHSFLLPSIQNIFSYFFFLAPSRRVCRPLFRPLLNAARNQRKLPHFLCGREDRMKRNEYYTFNKHSRWIESWASYGPGLKRKFSAGINEINLIIPLIKIDTFSSFRWVKCAFRCGCVYVCVCALFIIPNHKDISLRKIKNL